MPNLTIIIGDQTKCAQVEKGCIIGEELAKLELPLEQPCAGRGTYCQ